MKSTLPIAVALVPMSAWAAEPPTEPYAWEHHMMWGGGWYGMMFGPLFMILVLAVVIAAVVLIVRLLGGPWHGVAPPHYQPPLRTPLDILKERFARGEIDKNEFEERRRVLGEWTTMNILFILNDPPYGSERSYNGLRLALALAKNDPAAEITLFLMADAVACAKKGQKTPDGYYNIERMLKRFTLGSHRVLLCGTCMDARGLTDAEIVEGARRSTMDELAMSTATADKVLVF